MHAVPPAEPEVVAVPITTAPWLMVEAELQGVPVNLAIDTGSPWSVLDVKVAERLGLRGDASVRARDFEGKKATFDVVVSDGLTLGGTTFSKVGWVTRDLSKPSARSCLPLDGIIGHNVLRHMALELDIAGKTMVLAGSVDDLPVRDGGEVVALDPSSDRSQVRLPIDGPTRFMTIDTGSPTGLTASPEVMRQLDVGRSVVGRGRVSAGLLAADDDASEVQLFAWPALAVGGLDLHGVDAIGGVGSTAVGLDVLSHYLVRFDPASRTVTLWGNAEPPPTGLVDVGLRWAADSGAVTLVVDGSPAAKAGLALGDRVVEVDGTRLGDLDAPQLCWMALDAPRSESLWLRVERGGQPLFEGELREQALLP